MSQIFISHCHKDKNLVDKVLACFAQVGITVWTDAEINYGTHDWRVEIEMAIINSDIVLVLLSPDAKQSLYVREEIAFADLHQIEVIPVLITGTIPDSIPMRFASTQRYDLTKDFNNVMEEIVQFISSKKTTPSEEDKMLRIYHGYNEVIETVITNAIELIEHNTGYQYSALEEISCPECWNFSLLSNNENGTIQCLACDFSSPLGKCARCEISMPVKEHGELDFCESCRENWYQKKSS